MGTIWSWLIKVRDKRYGVLLSSVIGLGVAGGCASSDSVSDSPSFDDRHSLLVRKRASNGFAGGNYDGHGGTVVFYGSGAHQLILFDRFTRLVATDFDGDGLGGFELARDLSRIPSGHKFETYVESGG